MSEPIQAIATNNYLLAAPVGSGYMEASALEYDASGNISAYSGSAFTTQLPEEEEVEFEEINISGISAATDYVTATSGDINATIDNVSANSGAWGGSALPISAGPGIKFEMVDNTLVASTDETLLWSGADTSATQALSENITAFEEIKVYGKSHNFFPWISQVWVNSAVVYGIGSQMWWNNPSELDISRYCLSGDKIVPMKGSWYVWAGAGTTGDLTGNAAQASYICKVVGINRIAGGN